MHWLRLSLAYETLAEGLQACVSAFEAANIGIGAAIRSKCKRNVVVFAPIRRAHKHSS